VYTKAAKNIQRAVRCIQNLDFINEMCIIIVYNKIFKRVFIKRSDFSDMQWVKIQAEGIVFNISLSK